VAEVKLKEKIIIRNPIPTPHSVQIANFGILVGNLPPRYLEGLTKQYQDSFIF
jgi:hypothetical protein